MTRRTIAALACSLALVGSLAACSNNDTQEEAESAVCTSLAEVKTAAAGVKALNADSTVDEVEAAQQALESAIAGLRENAEDLDEADLPVLRRRDIRVGLSTHDDAELERALSLAPDYIALGPVYPTTLKQMPWSPQGLPRIGEWKRKIGALPLVAIGGITLQRAQGCFDAGADVVALVSDITRHPDPEAQTKAWLQATRGRA